MLYSRRKEVKSWLLGVGTTAAAALGWPAAWATRVAWPCPQPQAELGWVR